ncbi:hypothetical protein BYT27DRAFT_6334963 [Phlegmacium glaucopus]|nr:hypothetical protein BYT27DRAFT_6334963 [Phlegmacium glaucopus]
MLLKPTGEKAYYDDSGGGGYGQIEPGSPDTFFFVQPPSPPPAEYSTQVPSPAQVYAQSYSQTHNSQFHDEDLEHDRQPLTSDSTHTPPSPIALEKRSSAHRRSIQRPSQMSNHTPPMFKRTSNSRTTTTDTDPITTSGHSNNIIKDDHTHTTNKQRTRSLSTFSQKTLIHLLQTKEEETKRSKKMLKNALVQLEIEVGRGDVLEGRVKELEASVEREKIESIERERGGTKALKGVLDEQRGRAGGGQEVEGLKLKLSNTEKELERIKEEYRALQIERDESDRALVRARTLAREMKEKAILIQAREQGRQEGFEEGLRQGRLRGQSNEESSGDEASGSGNAGGGERARTRRTRERSTNKSSSRRHRSNTNPSQPSIDAEASIAAIRANAERENLRIQLQLKAVERELDMERSKMSDVVREKGHLERAVREEREKRLEKEREREAREREREAKERERERMEKEQERAEREKERAERERERERELRETMKRQVDQERERLEREKEQLMKEKQDVERKLAEAEEIRIKEKEKLEKQLKKEKDKAAARAAAAPPPAQPIPYLAMAPPPPPPIMPSRGPSTGTRVPRPPSSGSHRRPQTRPSSMDSYTSRASTIAFDMLQLPTGERSGDLSVILEDVSPSASNSVSGSAAAATAAAPAPPSWFTNPPIDYGKIQNDGGINRSGSPWSREPTNNHNGGGSHPLFNQHLDRNHLAPSHNIDRSSTRSSTGSYEFVIVPPSRPESVVGGADPEAFNNHNTHSHHNAEDPTFLSPNHRPTPLPRPDSPSAKPIPPRYSTTPQYNTSGITTQPNSPIMGGGVFPAGFIAQSITDSRGRSTPLLGGGMSGTTGFIPPLPGRSGTPNNQWHNPVIPPRSASPASIPIYGNPITLQRDKKRDQEDDLPATTAQPPPARPQSPEEWGGTLAGLHPPIFPSNSPHTPFTHPPPPTSWAAVKSPPDYSPVSSTRPVIPGQSSNLGGGGGGGSAWGTPSQRAGGFGFGSGMTPGPRNQDLAPVIPGQTNSGGYRPGMTPGPRNQDLAPVIPTPGYRPGMTPGPRNQDLAPVIPTPGYRPGMTPGPRNQDLLPVLPGQTSSGGGWGTPSHRGGNFGPGIMTPGQRNQDLAPVIPGQNGWGTPSHHATSSFGASGSGMTPGARNQELPNQSGFSIYAPANGARTSSPYRNEEEDAEDGDREDDPITALNTKLNAINVSLGVAPNVAPTVVPTVGMGGKKSKKGGKKR